MVRIHKDSEVQLNVCSTWLETGCKQNMTEVLLNHCTQEWMLNTEKTARNMKYPTHAVYVVKTDRWDFFLHFIHLKNHEGDSPVFACRLRTTSQPLPLLSIPTHWSLCWDETPICRSQYCCIMKVTKIPWSNSILFTVKLSSKRMLANYQRWAVTPLI